MKRWGIAALASGAVAALGAGAWAVERAVLRRVRRRADPDAGDAFELVFDDRVVVTTEDGAELVAYARGEGPPILFLHGWTLSARLWTKQFAGIGDRGFRVIAYDQRGHGASTPGVEGYSQRALAEDVRAVLEALEVRDAILVGHSMGGLALEAFASEFPELASERARGLVLLSTLARTMLGNPMRTLIEQVAERAPDLGWVIDRPDLGFLVARAGFGREPLPSHVEFARRLTTECSATTRRDAGRMLLDIDLTESLADIPVPTLIVVGSADLLTPPSGARLLHDLLTDARLEVMEGAGHMLMLERCAALEDLIVDFATELAVRPAPPRADATVAPGTGS